MTIRTSLQALRAPESVAFDSSDTKSKSGIDVDIDIDVVLCKASVQRRFIGGQTATSGYSGVRSRTIEYRRVVLPRL